LAALAVGEGIAHRFLVALFVLPVVRPIVRLLGRTVGAVTGTIFGPILRAHGLPTIAVGALVAAAPPISGPTLRPHGLRTIAVAVLVASAAAPAPATPPATAAVVLALALAALVDAFAGLAVLRAFGLVGRRLIGDCLVGRTRQFRPRPLAVVTPAAHALDLAIGG